MDFKAFKYLLFNNFIDYSRIVKIIFAYQIFDLIEFYFITGYCFEIIMNRLLIKFLKNQNIFIERIRNILLEINLLIIKI